jgi:hypothetical protein
MSRDLELLQHRLDDLLERNIENRLAADEQLELDELLTRVDQLTILKTRARPQRCGCCRPRRGCGPASRSDTAVSGPSSASCRRRSQRPCCSRFPANLFPMNEGINECSTVIR